MSVQTIHLNGRDYVMLERSEYDKLTTLAKAADLPPLPQADAQGNYPAVAYARATIARGIIRDRVALGWTQRELARRAGISFENLCRIERGRHTPSLATIEKIDRALKQAAHADNGGRPNRKARKAARRK